MASRRDSRFLLTFFTVLGVVFVIAVYVKLRAYVPAEARENDAQKVQTTSSATEIVVAQDVQVIAPPSTYIMNPNADPVEAAAARAAAEQEKLLSAPLPAGPAPTITKPPVVSTPAARRPAGTVPVAQPGGASSRMASAGRDAAQRASQQSNVTQSSRSNGPSTSHEPGSTTTRTDTPKENPKDPTSDTTPPQLVSVDFAPPAIQDGEETVLTIAATDDLSGVRVISGTIATPTGGLQGFALQRESPESPRYTTRIAVPKDAPEGLWHITYLSLSDNAGNTATLSSNQGTLAAAGFRVSSSKSDTKAPTLSAVWLDRVAMRAGEKNTVFVQASDEGTGINLISGVFQSPGKFARIGFGCHAGEQAWACDFTPPASADCGEWKLEQIQLQDKANNMATIRSDNPLIQAIRLNMGGNDCDSKPPELQSLVLDRGGVSNAEKSTIGVTATVMDDLSGVASISGQVTGPSSPKGTPRLYFSMSAGGDPNIWVGQIIVPALAAKGQWEVAWIQILDKANNLKTYSRSDPVLQRAVFGVQ